MKIDIYHDRICFISENHAETFQLSDLSYQAECQYLDHTHVPTGLTIMIPSAELSFTDDPI